MKIFILEAIFEEIPEEIANAIHECVIGRTVGGILDKFCKGF